MASSEFVNDFSKWLRHKVVLQKLNNPLGYIFIVLFSVMLGLVIGMTGIKTGAIMLGGLMALPVLFLILADLQIGLILILIVAFLTNLLAKIGDYPVGIALDALAYFMLFAIFIRQIKERNWEFVNNPISFFIIIWICYSMIMALNPEAESIKAWLYSVRAMAGLIIIFFIALYAFNSLERIKLMFKVILFLSFLAALYGLKQEWIGFEDWEMAWLRANERRWLLIVQWGRVRVFSIFSDPTTMGIPMVYMSVFSIILATAPIKIWKRVALIVAACAMLLCMGYGGSRTPVVLIPIGFMFYVLLTLQRKILMVSGIGFLLFFVIMLKDSSNPVLYRLQSAFRSNDASVQVRLDNQRLIQPYIRTHPFGSGLGSTGIMAQRFSPNSKFANFAHDSGFVRVAVEMGWIGLLIYMALLFKILQTGVYYYLRVRDPVIKTMYLAINCLIFILIVASYPQEIIILLPTSIIFYICAAAIIRLKDFDPAFKALQEGSLRGKEMIKVEEEEIRV